MTAKQLQAMRHKAGLSTAELARRLRVSPRSIEDWEQGRRRVPILAELVLTGRCPCCRRPCLKERIDLSQNSAGER